MLDILDRVKNIGYKTALIVFLGYATLNTFYQNGYFDSKRTKQAIKQHSQSNPIKVVKQVEEEYKDNKIFSLTMDGYNPRVIRKVSFEDGSQTTLDYRLVAWQPFKNIRHGKEFDPKSGQKYEVTKNNNLVQLLN